MLTPMVSRQVVVVRDWRDEWAGRREVCQKHIRCWDFPILANDVVEIWRVSISPEAPIYLESSSNS